MDLQDGYAIFSSRCRNPDDVVETPEAEHRGIEPVEPIGRQGTNLTQRSFDHLANASGRRDKQGPPRLPLRSADLERLTGIHNIAHLPRILMSI